MPRLHYVIVSRLRASLLPEGDASNIQKTFNTLTWTTSHLEAQNLESSFENVGEGIKPRHSRSVGLKNKLMGNKKKTANGSSLDNYVKRVFVIALHLRLKWTSPIPWQ